MFCGLGRTPGEAFMGLGRKKWALGGEKDSRPTRKEGLFADVRRCKETQNFVARFQGESFDIQGLELHPRRGLRPKETPRTWPTQSQVV